MWGKTFCQFSHGLMYMQGAGAVVAAVAAVVVVLPCCNPMKNFWGLLSI